MKIIRINRERKNQLQDQENKNYQLRNKENKNKNNLIEDSMKT